MYKIHVKNKPAKETSHGSFKYSLHLKQKTITVKSGLMYTFTNMVRKILLAKFKDLEYSICTVSIYR